MVVPHGRTMARSPFPETRMSAPNATPEPSLQHTPLHALHLELGARMVPFAGYAMPVQYPAGLMAEHQHTRAAAGDGVALLEGGAASGRPTKERARCKG